MRVMAFFSTSFFPKYLRVVKDGPGRGHLCQSNWHISSYSQFHYENSRVATEMDDQILELIVSTNQMLAVNKTAAS